MRNELTWSTTMSTNSDSDGGVSHRVRTTATHFLNPFTE